MGGHFRENIESGLLFCIAFFTQKLSLGEMDLIMRFCFNCLSIISVVMIIIINFMAFSYAIRGVWVRIIRFIYKITKRK
jgi:hypothetical protein